MQARHLTLIPILHFTQSESIAHGGDFAAVDPTHYVTSVNTIILQAILTNAVFVTSCFLQYFVLLTLQQRADDSDYLNLSSEKCGLDDAAIRKRSA